jgi:hypothetical protein
MALLQDVVIRSAAKCGSSSHSCVSAQQLRPYIHVLISSEAVLAQFCVYAFVFVYFYISFSSLTNLLEVHLQLFLFMLLSLSFSVSFSLSFLFSSTFCLVSARTSYFLFFICFFFAFTFRIHSSRLATFFSFPYSICFVLSVGLPVFSFFL